MFRGSETRWFSQRGLRSQLRGRNTGNLGKGIQCQGDPHAVWSATREDGQERQPRLPGDDCLEMDFSSRPLTPWGEVV